MASDARVEDERSKKDKRDRKEKKKEKKRKREKELEEAAQSNPNGSEIKHKKAKTTTNGPIEQTPTKKDKKQKEHKSHRGTADAQSAAQQSPFVQRTVSFYVTLSPCANNFPLQGICAEHLSPLILTYYAPLKGILLSYSNPRLSDKPDPSSQAPSAYGKSIDEYGVTFVWVTAEFLVFQPTKGSYLEGHVNLQNENLLGLMCYNYFNAAIERSGLPADWEWKAANGADADTAELGQTSGHFVDGTGNPVTGRLRFRVKDFDVVPGPDANSGSMIHIYGTLAALS